MIYCKIYIYLFISFQYLDTYVFIFLLRFTTCDREEIVKSGIRWKNPRMYIFYTQDLVKKLISFIFINWYDSLCFSY